MGLFRSAMRETKKRTYTDKELFHRYLKDLHPFRKNILFIALFIIIQTIVDLVNPIFVRIISDEIIADLPNYSVAYTAAIAYFICLIFNWFAFAAQRIQLGKYVPLFLEKIRIALFNKIQEQDMIFFDQRMSGNLNSIIVNDTLDFSNTAVLISDAIGNIVISLFTFGILLYFNWLLALITFTAIPILLFLMYSLRRIAKRVSKAYRKAIGNVNAAMVESIEGIHISKSFGQESKISNHFESINQRYFRAWMRLTAVTHFWRPLLNTLTSVILCLVLYFGGNLVILEDITPGTLVMFILYLQNFFRPIMVLGRFFPELSGGLAAYERIINIMDAKPSVHQKSETYPLEKMHGNISFNHIQFGYDDENIIFEDLNLKIRAGEKIAIVGHTGAGKTSLISLLARYYEFQSGSLLIDGHDIRNLDLKSYRRFFGKVEQDVYLFPGTILENVKYGRDNVSEEDIWKALRVVQAHDFIEQLPNGIHTVIGDRGNDLSAGQRQLISFARAILLNPQILILDEATSSVDAYTEAMIQEALEIVLENRTSIIIAHRLSTIVNADRIIVFDHGKIIEEGTHSTLLESQGQYAQLYQQYFAHQSLEWQEKHNHVEIEH